MYNFDTLKMWGSNFVNETDQELLLILNTRLGSVAFNRSLGIIDNENIPMSNEFSTIYSVQILDALERYNETSRRERQVISDFDSIKEIDFDTEENTIENEVGYFRVVDYIVED